MTQLHLRIIITISLSASFGATDASSADEPTAITAAEAVRDEIDSQLGNGGLREQTKNFGWATPGCEISGYPILERSIAEDSSRKVRRLIQKQVVSHGSIQTIRSYFDERGGLRYVDRQLGGTTDRVFLDSDGRIVAGFVSHDSRKIWKPASFDHEDYFMRPSSAAQAKLQFAQEEPTCRPGAN